MKFIKLIIIIIISFYNITLAKGEINNEIRVRIEKGINPNDVFNELAKKIPIHSIEQLKKINNLELSEIRQVDTRLFKASEVLSRTYRIKFNEKNTSRKALKQIKKSINGVELVELIQVPDLMSIDDFNDPLRFDLDWLIQIKAFEAFEIEDGDENIIIGISDAGILSEHEDLVNSLATFEGEIPNNKIDDDGNGYIDDYNGFNLVPGSKDGPWGNPFNSSEHGTRCAGIIGATQNNGLGILGSGGKCKIFPIKMAPFGTEFLTHSYESIIFAADRGIDILNCSWGAQGFYSGIEQSIIDYAIAKGMLVIVSSGNVDFSVVDEDRIKAFYPAAYKGVLSVGSVNSNDIVAGSSSLGTHNRIMAKGVDNITTENSDDKYDDKASGTSFAAPVVAGAAGIVKARYPELSPEEIAEHLRLSTDIISNINASIKEILPGRLNLLKAVTTDPFSRPSFRLENYSFSNEANEPRKRYNENQVVKISLDIKRFLGGEGEYTFTLSEALNLTGDDIDIINNSQSINVIDEDNYQLNDFSFRVIRPSPRPILFRVDISGANNYSDFFLFEFTSDEPVLTLENDGLIFSLADNGRIGYSDDSQVHGEGFAPKDQANWLWQAGYFLVNKNGYSSAINEFSSLETTKEFTGSDFNVNTIFGTDAQSRASFYLSQEAFISSLDRKWGKINITLSNRDKPATDSVGFGISMDWDMGFGDDYEVNITENLDGVFVDDSNPNSTLAQCAFDTSYSYFIGAALHDKTASGIVSAGGGESFNFFNINKNDAIELTSSGSSIQSSDTIDVGFFIGAFFPEGFNNGDIDCTVCLAAASSKEELRANLNNCLNNINSVENQEYENFISYSKGFIRINKDLNDFDLQIYDLNGALVNVFKSLNNQEIPLDLKRGVYFVKVIDNGNSYDEKILVY